MKIIKSYSNNDIFKIFLINLLIHFVSFCNLYLILTILKIKLSFSILLLLYFFYYLSGIFQIFPGGLGIRELLFFLLSNIANLNTDDLLNLSIFITSFNIIFSIIIYFILSYLFFMGPFSNLSFALDPKIAPTKKKNNIFS